MSDPQLEARRLAETIAAFPANDETDGGKLARAYLTLAQRVEDAQRALDDLRHRSVSEPLRVDVSDYGDIYVLGFLAGQTNALDAARQALRQEGER